MARNGKNGWSVERFSGGANFAAAVAEMSKARLSRWKREGVFWSEYEDKRGKKDSYARLYSYNDMVRLCVLRILSDEHRVSLNELRKADGKLKKNAGRPWSEIDLNVAGKKIASGAKGRPRNGAGGADFQNIPVAKIAKDAEKRIDELRRRAKDDIGKTERRRGVMRSAEIFCGTRIPVETVLDFLEAGYGSKKIIREYPSLTREDVAVAKRRLGQAA